MRRVIVLTFEASDSEWAAEYGLTPAEAERDFADSVSRAVEDGDIVGTLEQEWPAMKGHIRAEARSA